MKDTVITGLFTLGGTILGFSVKFMFDFFQDKRSRRDRYYFAMLEKRFEANQKAFSLAVKLKSVIHEDETKKYEVTKSVKEWYDNHCLYLPPTLRKDFRSVIKDVDMYGYQLEDYKATGREQGWNTEETKKKREELNQTFRNIMQGIQDKIEAHIDIYYKLIE